MNTNRNGYKHLIQYALDKGLTLSVCWEDETDLDKSSNFNEIVDAVEATESPVLVVFDGEENRGAAFIIVGLDDQETVADYSVNEFFDGWEKAFDEVWS